jgi:hypothetical protein
MLDQSLKATGKLNLKLIDPKGNITLNRDEPNIVTFQGLTYIASRMFGVVANTPTAMTHMSIGTDSTTAQNVDFKLGGELTTTRVALDSTTLSSSGTAGTAGQIQDSVQYIATFNPGIGTGAVTEAGIFNTASGTSGTMLCRTTFNVINKGAQDTLVITWKVTVA